MKRIFFVSDAHFGAESEESEALKADRFFSFLEYVESLQADLIIVGDLFDFWFEYRYAVPRRHFDILARLSEMSKNGHTIHYMAGNHDFWLGPFMEKEVGMVLHPNEYIVSDNGAKIYIRHGDGLLKNDYGYRFLKKVLRSPVNIFLYRLLHPDVGIPLALFFSSLSRGAQRDRSNYSDHDYRQYAFQKIDEGYGFVVLGHTHWSALDKHDNGWYVNPGEWMYEYSFAMIENGVPAIYKWNGISPQPVDPVLPPGNPKNNG